MVVRPSEQRHPEMRLSGEMDIVSFGINWWLTPVFNVNINYRYITLDRFGFESSSNGFMTRILLVLE